MVGIVAMLHSEGQETKISTGDRLELVPVSLSLWIWWNSSEPPFPRTSVKLEALCMCCRLHSAS